MINWFPRALNGASVKSAYTNAAQSHFKLIFLEFSQCINLLNAQNLGPQTPSNLMITRKVWQKLERYLQFLLFLLSRCYELQKISEMFESNFKQLVLAKKTSENLPAKVNSWTLMKVNMTFLSSIIIQSHMATMIFFIILTAFSSSGFDHLPPVSFIQVPEIDAIT